MRDAEIRRKPRSVSRRFIVYTVMCSSLVTLILTFFQLYRDYRSDVAETNKGLEQIRAVHLETIVDGLWQNDVTRLQTILEGMSQFRDLKYAAVIEGDTVLVSVGVKPATGNGFRTFPLIYTYRGGTEDIGSLEVAIDLEAAYRRVIDRAVVILLSNTLKTALVVCFMLLVFHRLLGRHFSAITDYVSHLNLSGPTESLELSRKTNPAHPDELDFLVGSINDTTQRLIGTIDLEKQIAESRLAQEALQDSERRLLRILDSSPFGVAIGSKATRRRLYVNRRFMELFGSESVEASVQQEIADSYVFPEEMKANWDAFERDGILPYVENQRRRSDGTVWWAASYWREFSFGGETAVMVWFVDVTERKKAEMRLEEKTAELDQLNRGLERAVDERTRELKASKEEAEDARLIAEQSNNTKTEFLANMSHELRTPLNAILGFSEMIKFGAFGPLDAKYVEYAADINKAGEHLLGVIADLLDLSKVERGQLDIKKERIDVREAFQVCRALMINQVQKAGLTLSMDIADDLPLIEVDPQRFRQILLNLIDNAIKFTEKGGAIRISTRRGPEGIVISIKDNGIGIANDDIPRALEKFGQVRKNHTLSHAGAGIGLALAKSFVEVHGGSLIVQSEIGEGTTVTVELPET